jgi:hypothetical protein
MHALSARTGLEKWTAIVATKTAKTPGILGPNELARSGIGFSLADESSLWSNMQASNARFIESNTQLLAQQWAASLAR